MNELQVKTIEIKPAVVEFNHKEIEKELIENLSTFKGLTYSKEAVSELRSVIAYLRKGKKSVLDYKIKTKKVLVEPIGYFEGQIGHLTGLFDNTINPLNDQLKEFIEAERQEKLEAIKLIRTELIEKYELNSEYAERVDILDTYLNKSTSIKQASESIEFQIKRFKFEQDKVIADKETIVMSVKLANAENKLSLSENAYIRLLEFDSVDQVKEQIDIDAKKAVEKLENDKRIADEKAEKERLKQIEIAEKLEKERLKKIADEEKEKIVAEEKQVIPEISAAPIIEDLPFMDEPEEIFIPDMPIEETQDEVFTRAYSVNLTLSQATVLERFMTDNGIDWSVE